MTEGLEDRINARITDSMANLTINKINPVVDIALEKQHVVHVGAKRNTYYVLDSISWGTPFQPFTQAQWTIYPPSLSSIVSRSVKIKCYFDLVFNTPANDHLWNALRQWPIHSLIDNLAVQFNGVTINDRIGYKIHALSAYGLTDKMSDQEFSTSALMPDQFMQYGDWQTYGSARNPLGNYGENSDQANRGGFQPVLDDGKGHVQFIVSESIMLPPFLSGNEANLQEGFTQIQQMNVTINWRPNLNYIWSSSNDALAPTVTSCAVTMYQAPQLLYTYYTPKGVMPPIPFQILPYSQMNDFPRQQTSLASGAADQYVSDSFKLSQIPHRMYIFAQTSRNQLLNGGVPSFNYPNNFLTITNLSVLWNNENNLFNTCNVEQLYDLCVDNGLTHTFQQFTNFRGSVLCIDFAKNVGLEDNETAGVRGSYTCQVTANFLNKTGATMVPEFWVIFQYGGFIKIHNNTAELSLGNLTQEMVAFSHANSDIMPHDPTDVYKLGRGSFWSDFKSVINKITRGISTAAPVLAQALPQYAPLIQGVAQVAKVGQNLTGGSMSGGAMSYGRMANGRLNMRKLR